MNRDNLMELNLATRCLSVISRARVVSLLVGGVKKLTSLLVMLSFTVSAFIVLVISVVLMTVESVISAVFSHLKASKKATLQDVLQDERFSPKDLSQTK